MKITPLLPTGRRISIEIEPIELPRGRKYTRVITLKNTNKSYFIEGIPCSLSGCHCDAMIVAKVE